MPITLKNIERPYGSNPSGLRMIYLIYADQVLSTDPLEIAPGAVAYSLFLADLDASIQYSIKDRAFDWEIEINFPGDNESLAWIRKHFVRRQFVVVTEDFFGRMRIIGRRSFPLNCKVSGEITYKLSFTGSAVDVSETILALPESIVVEPLVRKIGPNPSGVRHISILFADQVISIPDPDENDIITSNPEVFDTAELIQYYTGDLDTKYDLDIDNGDSGVLYEHKLSIQIAYQQDPALDKLISSFRERQIILIIEDFFLDDYIIGCKKYPLAVKIKYDSGGDSGFRGYTLSFEGKTYTPAYLFEGELAGVEPPAPPAPAPTMIDFDPNDFSSDDFY